MAISPNVTSQANQRLVVPVEQEVDEVSVPLEGDRGLAALGGGRRALPVAAKGGAAAEPGILRSKALWRPASRNEKPTKMRIGSQKRPARVLPKRNRVKAGPSTSTTSASAVFRSPKRSATTTIARTQKATVTMLRRPSPPRVSGRISSIGISIHRTSAAATMARGVAHFLKLDILRLPFAWRTSRDGDIAACALMRAGPFRSNLRKAVNPHDTARRPVGRDRRGRGTRDERPAQHEPNGPTPAADIVGRLRPPPRRSPAFDSTGAGRQPARFRWDRR